MVENRTNFQRNSLVELLMANDLTEKYQNFKTQREPQIEREFLMGNKDEALGIYCDIFSAKSNILNTIFNAQVPHPSILEETLHVCLAHDFFLSKYELAEFHCLSNVLRCN